MSPTATTGLVHLPDLDPRLPVLVRPGGRLQIGWDPDSAFVLTPPPGVDAAALASVLQLLDGRTPRPTVVWRAVALGIDPADMSALLRELDEAGLLLPARAQPDPERTVQVHGRGPLGDAISAGLAPTVRVERSSHFASDTDVSRWNCVCVVLTDDLVADPRLVDALFTAGIPHLQVRLRDGRGVVGPLVLPGTTSCLRCADLTRCDTDDEWPHVAAQLLGRVGHAGPATVAATAAIALAELEKVLSGRLRPAPASLDVTLEIDLDSYRLAVRPWRRHPRCGCSRSTTILDEAPNLPP